MNYKRDVFPNLKYGEKWAMHEWGNKVKCIQFNKGKGNYPLSTFDDPNIDILPFIEVFMADGINDGVEKKEIYAPGEQRYIEGNPSWQPAPGDQDANDWYKLP